MQPNVLKSGAHLYPRPIQNTFLSNKCRYKADTKMEMYIASSNISKKVERQTKRTMERQSPKCKHIPQNHQNAAPKLQRQPDPGCFSKHHHIQPGTHHPAKDNRLRYNEIHQIHIFMRRVQIAYTLHSSTKSKHELFMIRIISRRHAYPSRIWI